MSGWNAHGIPYETHEYAARPYFNEALGLWLMGASLALFAAVLAGWGAVAFAVSLLLVAVGVAEVLLDRAGGEQARRDHAREHYRAIRTRAGDGRRRPAGGGAVGAL